MSPRSASSCVRPSIGSSTAVVARRPRARRSRRAAARRAARRRRSSRGRADDASTRSASVSRARLGLRRDAGDRDLAQPVPLRRGSRTPRGSSRSRAARSGRGRGGTRGRARASSRDEPLGRSAGRWSAAPILRDDRPRTGRGSSQTCGSPSAVPREAARAASSCVAVRAVERLLDRGLEAVAEVEHEVGALDVARRPAASARGRAARRPAASGSGRRPPCRRSLGREGERIEGRHDGGPARAVRAAAAPQPDAAVASRMKVITILVITGGKRYHLMAPCPGRIHARTVLLDAGYRSRRGAGGRRPAPGAARTAASAPRRSTTAADGEASRRDRERLSDARHAAELRLVQRIDAGDGIARFEPLQPDGDHHHHLVCRDCGKVEAFSDPTARARNRSRGGDLPATRSRRTRSCSRARAPTAPRFRRARWDRRRPPGRTRRRVARRRRPPPPAPPQLPERPPDPERPQRRPGCRGPAPPPEPPQPPPPPRPRRPLGGLHRLQLLLRRQLAALGHDQRPHLGGDVLEELDRDLVAADPLDRVGHRSCAGQRGSCA